MRAPARWGCARRRSSSALQWGKASLTETDFPRPGGRCHRRCQKGERWHRASDDGRSAVRRNSPSRLRRQQRVALADFYFGLERPHKNQSAVPTAPPCFGLWPRSSPLPSKRGPFGALPVSSARGRFQETLSRNDTTSRRRAQPQRAGARKPVQTTFANKKTGPARMCGSQ